MTLTHIQFGLAVLLGGSMGFVLGMLTSIGLNVCREAAMAYVERKHASRKYKP